MDPIGFTLENFDAIGQWRTEDGGVPVDATGEIVDGTMMNGVGAARRGASLLAAVRSRRHREAADLRLGRGASIDMPLVRSIVRESAPGNYRFSSLVLGIVKSQQFQMNTKTSGDANAQVATR